MVHKDMLHRRGEETPGSAERRTDLIIKLQTRCKNNFSFLYFYFSSALPMHNSVFPILPSSLLVEFGTGAAVSHSSDGASHPQCSPYCHSSVAAKAPPSVPSFSPHSCLQRISGQSVTCDNMEELKDETPGVTKHVERPSVFF